MISVKKRMAIEISTCLHRHLDKNMAVPLDEYDHEAELLIGLLATETVDISAQAISKSLAQIFSKEFEDVYSAEEFSTISRTIESIILKYDRQAGVFGEELYGWR